MILKYMDSSNNWNWIGSIKEINHKGSRKEGDTHVLDVEVHYETDEFEALSLNVRRAYLCDSSTGSTIDNLLNG